MEVKTSKKEKALTIFLVVGTSLAAAFYMWSLLIPPNGESNPVEEAVGTVPVQEFVDCWKQREPQTVTVRHLSSKSTYDLEEGTSYCLVVPQEGWDF
jgi:hypothetical protein